MQKRTCFKIVAVVMMTVSMQIVSMSALHVLVVTWAVYDIVRMAKKSSSPNDANKEHCRASLAQECSCCASSNTDQKNK